jgi:membrane protease YdiL (CAAX protease family)
LTIRLPAGWKGVLLAIVLTIAFVLIGFGVSLLLVALYVAATAADLAAAIETVQTPGGVATLVQGTAQLVGFLLATLMVGKWALGWKFRDLRWTGGREALVGALRGLGLGAGAAALAMGAAVLLGVAFWSSDRGGVADYVAQVTKTATVLAPAALSEEVMFRGLPLVLLAGIMGRWPALVLVAGVLFSLVHGLNPNITPLAYFNIALAGVFLGVAFYAPGGIWTAFGAHLGWNATLAALDAPVSGMPFRIPLLDYHTGNPSWVSGGQFGPEGGVLATVALGAALLIARRWSREKAA